MDLTYTFEAELFTTTDEASWVFVALPANQADEILDIVPNTPGFGSVRVAVQIGASQWATSIFPSKPLSTYLLPIKKAIRRAEQIEVGDSVEVTVRILLE